MEKAHSKLFMNNTPEGPPWCLSFVLLWDAPGNPIFSSSSVLEDTVETVQCCIPVYLDFEIDNIACEGDGSGKNTQ